MGNTQKANPSFKLKKNTTIALIGIVAVVLGVLMIPTNASNQLTLSSTDDTYTDWNDSSSNYGGQTNLIVTVNDYTDKYTWLKFDLSQVPEGAVIDKATLKLYAWTVSETFNISAHFCSDDSWTEFTVTYDNQPQWNQTPIDIAYVGVEGWHSWDVADAVKSALDIGKNSLTIVLQENWDHVYQAAWFYSKESELYIPQLVVEYIPPDTIAPPSQYSPPSFSLDLTYVVIAAVIGSVFILIATFFILKKTKKI